MRLPIKLQCPKCRSYGNFGVSLTVHVAVKSDGTLISSIPDAPDVNSKDECQCAKCGYIGTAEEFERRHINTYVEQKRGIKTT
jgi:hypothetical protein